MFYIKYLDPIVWTGKFMKVSDIEELKPRAIEAVGFKIPEDENTLNIANNVVANFSVSGVPTESYKRVLFVPKSAVVESREATDEDISNMQLREITYIDAQQTSDGMALTQTKLKNMPKPPLIKLCGFLVKEDDDNLYLSMEKNIDGMHRTVNIIPKKFIIK
jgi:hypothetical protein